MRILYGVQGTGNGHITRARHLAKGFAERSDVQVDFLFSGRHADQYFDMGEFAHYQCARGLSFVTENGRIRRRKTLLSNNLMQFAHEIKDLLVKDYDLLINDFEPVSAWAAKFAGLPSLSVSHQAAFLHQVPKHNQSLIDRVITKHFAPTEYSLGTHWYHFGHHIIPPFVAQELASAASKKRRPKPLSTASKQCILIYLPFESLSDIQEQLHTLSDYDFISYHPSIQQEVKHRNIQWKPLSKTAFKQDLLNCAGVISNCGFELSTECLSLGKALLVKPLQGQYEQLSNAYTLHQLGICEVMHQLNADEIDDWLQVKQGVKIDYPSDCDELIDWIVQGNWQAPEHICERLWNKVSFPASVKSKLSLMRAN